MWSIVFWITMSIGLISAGFVLGALYMYQKAMNREKVLHGYLKIAGDSAGTVSRELTELSNWIYTDYASHTLNILLTHPSIEVLKVKSKYNEEQLLKCIELPIVDMQKVLVNKINGVIMSIQNTNYQELRKQDII